ncbi:MAG: corrinoid protein [Acidimicrobiia bacterium]
MGDRILEEIRQALLNYEEEEVCRLATASIEEGIDPLETIEMLTSAITDIGERFGSGELWLPELLRGAKAMNSAMPLLHEEIKSRGGKPASRGTIVIGTVFGDIHSIGLDIVATLLSANGFEVKNLGVNVTAEEFIEAVRSEEPDLLGMSALLTTTAPEQKRVIDHLVAENLRAKIKVMVGGGPITETFAREIGADGYAPTASLAVDLAVRLLAR